MEPMPTQNRVYTTEDLERLPEDWRVELVDGDLVMAPSPVPWHQMLAKRLISRLDDYVGTDGEDRVLPAPLDVSVDKTNVYQPDVLVLGEGVRAEGIEWKIPTPIWVAEVISPYTAQHDLKKLPFYASKGVREAWLLYPEDETVVTQDFATGTVTEYRRPQPAPSSALPGFVLDLERFFRSAAESE